MNTQNQSNFTRGAQIFAHKVRMFNQSIINSYLVGAAVAIIWIIWRIVRKLSAVSLYYFVIERFAYLKIAIGEVFYPVEEITIKFYSLSEQRWIQVYAQEYVFTFWHTTPYGNNIQESKQLLIHLFCLEGICVFVVVTIAIIIFFMWQGKKMIIKSKVRGATLIDAQSLANILKKERKASSIKFAGLPLVKGSERKHILITGTTGTGKTNMLNELLPQIRSQGKRAVIVDLTGSFTSRFYDSKYDKILNPFTPNTEHWLPWNDCHKSVDFDDIASSFSNCHLKGDDFFAKNAELVLSAGLLLFQDSRDIKQLVKAVLYSNNKQFTSTFKNSPVAGIINNSAPETSASIQATLGKNISVLQHLKNGGNFSIKRWIENTSEQGWLFLTASPNERATLQPLISAWISIAVKALMARSPEDSHADMWFIIDELAALRQIPILPTALAESRKYGGCFVAGIQNTHQLEGIYGTTMGAAMLDLFNSKFVFRVSDQQTAYRASMLLGEQETIETQETMSYGSNTIRDGVNMNNIERRRLLVIPSEIMHLPEVLMKEVCKFEKKIILKIYI